jgi:hypothetical protein
VTSVSSGVVATDAENIVSVGISFCEVTNTFTVKGVADCANNASLPTIVNAASVPFAFAAGVQYAVFDGSIVQFEVALNGEAPIFNVPDVNVLTINAFTTEFELVSALSRSYDMVIFEASSSGIGDKLIVGNNIAVSVGGSVGIDAVTSIDGPTLLYAATVNV